MTEIQLLIIGALIGLACSLIVQLVSHLLSGKRDKTNWERQEREKLYNEKVKLESKIVELKNESLDYLIYGIILMNQLRDALRGFTQDEQFIRAEAMKEVLTKCNIDELKAIAKGIKSLPELPGKPQSLRP